MLLTAHALSVGRVTDHAAFPAFDRYGPADPLTPLLLSVPHAGRDYPEKIGNMLRVPLQALRLLEDRLVDQVALAASGNDHRMLIARTPRAWIDLNRSEQERDPLLDLGAGDRTHLHRSAKLRSGLGLVPRRAGAAGDLWSRKLSAEDVEERIRNHHRPFHAEVSEALAAAHARFGVAVLLDIHSMPPLTGPRPAEVVLGDLFGRSSDQRYVAALAEVATHAGLRVAFNAPYAGGQILARHAAPKAGIHAVQIELDRRLYLDERMEEIGPGLPLLSDTLRRMIAAVHDAVQPAALAAE